MDGSTDAESDRGDLCICGEVAAGADHFQKAGGCCEILGRGVQPNDIRKLEPVGHAGAGVLHVERIPENLAVGGQPNESEGHHRAEPDFFRSCEDFLPPLEGRLVVGAILIGGVEKKVRVGNNHASTRAGGNGQIGFGFQIVGEGGEGERVDPGAKTHRLRGDQFRGTPGWGTQGRTDRLVNDLLEGFFCKVLLLVKKAFHIRIKRDCGSHKSIKASFL